MINKLIREIEDATGKIGICAKNSTSTLFEYNSNKSFDTACSVMVYVLLEYFKLKHMKKITGEEEVEYTEENYATGAGSIKFLRYGSKIKVCDLVRLMIGISDHIAANLLIDFLGLDNINKTILDNGFTKTKLNHKFIIPKLKNMGESTPNEYTKFYKKLDCNQFYSEKICTEMKDILLTQKYKDILGDKIVERGYTSYLNMACKSGKADGRIYDTETPSYIVDGGIIFTRIGNYYISIFAELPVSSEFSLNYVKDKMQGISEEVFINYTNKGVI